MQIRSLRNPGESILMVLSVVSGMRSVQCFGLILLAASLSSPAIASDENLIEHIKSGNSVLMIRHALAPGIGDPDGFDLNDCSTQRNLNDQGREQAKSIGQWLRRQGITRVKLYSSQWCRCLETARLMQMGEVTALAALNSFFESPQDREPKLMALRKFIQDNSRSDELIIMVTHQVTISGITGEWTDSGHGKLVRSNNNGDIELLGNLKFD